MATHQKQNLNRGKESTRKRHTRRPTNQGPVVTALKADLGVLQRAVANPDLASSDDILSLQRTYGNRAVSGLLAGASHPLQAKSAIRVGPAGDQYEQEADRVAERVMTMSIPTNQPPVQRQVEEEELLQAEPLAASITPVVRRQVEEEEELLQGKSTLQRQEEEELLQGKSTLQRQEEEEELLQGKSTLQRQVDEEELLQGKSTLQRQVDEEELLQGKSTLQRQVDEEELLQGKSTIRRAATDDGFEVDSDVEERLDTLRGRGSSLPDEVRTDMEARFGTDFSQVRVHADGEADELSQALRAHAFTHGVDIYFAAGQDDFSSSGGKRLLAHELTHVVQQTGGQPSPVTPSRPQAVQGASIVQRFSLGKWLGGLFGKKKKPERVEDLKSWPELERQIDQIHKLVTQAGVEGPLDLDKLEELVGQTETTSESLESESQLMLEEEQEKFDQLYEDFEVKQQLIDESMEDIFGLEEEDELKELERELGISLGEEEELTEEDELKELEKELGVSLEEEEELTEDEELEKLAKELGISLEEEELTPEERELAKKLEISPQDIKLLELSPEEVKQWLEQMSQEEEKEKKPALTLGGREDTHEKSLAWKLPEEKPKEEEKPLAMESVMGGMMGGMAGGMAGGMMGGMMMMMMMGMMGGSRGMGPAMPPGQIDSGLLSDVLNNVADLAARVTKLEEKEK
jgi:hypothetical protein